jgi:hypothetical protein
MPLAEIASGIAAKVAISAARPLLLALLGVQDQQLKLLTTMQDDIRKLLEGPWKQARLLVAEAAHSPDDDPQRRDYLEKGRDALIQAYGNYPHVHSSRAAIAADLAMGPRAARAHSRLHTMGRHCP